MDNKGFMKEEIERSLQEQIEKLAVVQFLIWQKELPEGFNRQAIDISFCYQLLKIPYHSKLNSISFACLRALVCQMEKKYDLPKTTEELKVLEKTFRLELGDNRLAVSDCSAVNRLLVEAGSKLRLCGGFYGAAKFYLLGEASEKKVGDCHVYRLKEEAAATPGCHLLMAAMVSGKNIFLREASARFLYYHKWRDKVPAKEAKAFIAAFMDRLYYHELNHDSLERYVKDDDLLAIARASLVLLPNVLSQLIEVFTDWLPGKGTKSPLQIIFEEENGKTLSLYMEDNCFYGSSFPEQESFTALDFAPLYRHTRDGKFDWPGLLGEIKDLEGDSLLGIYLKVFEETADKLKEIVKKAEFVLDDRPLGFTVISAYVENSLKDKKKEADRADYKVTYWSNLFNYLKQYSKDGCAEAAGCLKEAEKKLCAQN